MNGIYLLTVKEDACSINLPRSDFANEECAIPHWMQRMVKLTKKMSTDTSKCILSEGNQFLASGASFLEAADLPLG